MKKKQWNATRKGRYSGLKSRYWDYFSDKIRLRDFVKYGKCISGGEGFKRWQDSQAGHFISAGNCGFSLLFDETNVSAECQYDNAFNSNHQLLYAENLDKRYGKGTAENLKERYKEYHFKGKTTKEWTKREYEIKLEELKQEVSDFAIKSGIPF